LKAHPLPGEGIEIGSQSIFQAIGITIGPEMRNAVVIGQYQKDVGLRGEETGNRGQETEEEKGRKQGTVDRGQEAGDRSSTDAA
jgi:hypothetical protein